MVIRKEAKNISVTDAGSMDFQFYCTDFDKIAGLWLCSYRLTFMKSAFLLDFNMASASFYVQLILKSIVIVSMSFIALFIGLAMKSSKATIISSFLLIFLTQANIGDFTLKDNLAFPVILTGISVVFAVLSVCHAETKDLM